MTDQTSEQPSAQGMIAPRYRGGIRIGIGLLQGLTLFLLLGRQGPDELFGGGWTTSLPAPLFSGLLLAAFSIPVLLIGGVGQMRWRSLAIWAAVAALVLMGLGAYDAMRLGPQDPNNLAYRPYGWSSPSFLLMLFGVPALFIAHHLVAAADADGKAIASYRRYFDLGWTSAAQIAMAVALVIVLWIVLFLGSQLFRLVGITQLERLMQEPWFAWPVSCVTFAAGIHLTDVRAALVRNTRALALVLLSWLMPVMALFVALFVIALPFTGLEPLWATGSATSILLASAAVLVALINAAYQDGEADRSRSRFLTVASLVASATLLPLVGVAAYSLLLRIGQYGFTPDRIAALVAVVIAAVYAIGYLLRLVPQLRDRRPLERTNIVSAFVCLALFFAVFTPLADPARISVDDQVARLVKGKVAPDMFDYQFLRWQSARYGRDALAKLTALTDGPNAADIADRAKLAQTSDPYAYNEPPAVPVRERFTVYPSGRTMPESFTAMTPEQMTLVAPGSLCVTNRNAACDVYLLDIDKDGTEELLLNQTGYTDSGAFAPAWPAAVEVLRLEGGAWKQVGVFTSVCPMQLRDAVAGGKLAIEPSRRFDLVVGGQRFELEPNPGAAEACN